MTLRCPSQLIFGAWLCEMNKRSSLESDPSRYFHFNLLLPGFPILRRQLPLCLKKPLVSALAIVGSLVTLTTTTATAAPFNPELLIGKWKDPDVPVHVIFSANGTYGFEKGGSKNPSLYGHWKLEGDQLKWGKPFGSLTSTVLGLDQTKLIITSGSKATSRTYSRASSVPAGPQSVATGRDPARRDVANETPAGPTEEQMKKLLIGEWSSHVYKGQREFPGSFWVYFYPSGEWSELPHSSSVLVMDDRVWKISGDKLTRTFFEGKSVQTILQFGPKTIELVNGEGKKEVLKRVGDIAWPGDDYQGADIMGIRLDGSPADVLKILKSKGFNWTSDSLYFGDGKRYEVVTGPSAALEARLIKQGKKVPKSSLSLNSLDEILAGKIPDQVIKRVSLQDSRNNRNEVMNLRISFQEDPGAKFTSKVTQITLHQKFSGNVGEEPMKAARNHAIKKYGKPSKESIKAFSATQSWSGSDLE